MNKLILFFTFLFLVGCGFTLTHAQKLTKEDYVGTWIYEKTGEQLNIEGGTKSFLQSAAFATTASGNWQLDDDGRILFYPSANDVSKRDVFKVVDDKYLVKDETENNTLGLYDRYVVKYRAKDKSNNSKKDPTKDVKKKIEDIFDIFKK